MASPDENNCATITYVLEGDPVALARVRISRTQGVFRVFDSQKELKLISQITLRNQHGHRPLYKGPLHIDCDFYFHIPKTNKIARLGYYHVYKPDVDNLCKMILDISNGILFHDDSMVAEITCRKLYDAKPRTEFRIYKLENHENKKA